MTVIWQDPPLRKNAVITAEIIAELRARPGTWALIREYYGTRNSRIAKTTSRPADIELRTRYIGTDRIHLYARAIRLP